MASFTFINRLSLLILGFLVLSCTKDAKDSKAPLDTDLSLAGDVHKLEEESIRIFYMLEHLEQYQKVPSTTFPACASIIFDTVASNIKKITIDFGNGCKCDAIDGKNRKGKLEITWEGNYFQENGTRTIKSQNYFLTFGSKYYPVDIDFSIATNSYLQFSSSENITLYKTASDKITRTANKTYKWKKGKNTYTELYDDVIQVYGNGNGRNVDGKSFTTSVADNQSLVLDTGCKWLQSGILFLNPEDKNQRKIDYTGCDAYATVDIQGRVYTLNFMTLE